MFRDPPEEFARRSRAAHHPRIRHGAVLVDMENIYRSHETPFRIAPPRGRQLPLTKKLSLPNWDERVLSRFHPGLCTRSIEHAHTRCAGNGGAGAV